MSRNFKLPLITTAVVLILPIIGFTVPAQSDEPITAPVNSRESGDTYSGFIVREIEGNGPFQNIYSLLATFETEVDFGPGEPGYRGPRYEGVFVDEEGVETPTGIYFIIPLTGKPLPPD